MLNSFFHRNKSAARLALVIDIRSSSVAGSLVLYEDNKPAQVVSSMRDFFFFEDAVDSNVFIQKAEMSLNRVLEYLVHTPNYKQAITSVNVFYGAPWYKNYIENYSKIENTVVEFNDEYYKKNINNEIQTIGKSEEIIEKELIAVFLNGYHSKLPFGKKATEVDFSLYVSVLNKETKSNFFSIIRKYVGTKNIKHHSHTFAFYTVLHNLIMPPNNYVMLDISGEVTEISVVRNEHIVKIVSIPHGNNYFVRKVMKKIKSDYITSFNELKNKQDIITPDVKEEWSSFVKEALTSSNVQSLPMQIYVSTADETRELVKILLDDFDIYYNLLKINKKPDVVFLHKNLFKDKIVYANSNMRDDAHMMANILFVELFNNKS